MSNKEAYMFVTEDEFNIICESRIDDVRQSLYNAILLIREPHPNHRELSKTLEGVMRKISRVKLDMEDIARKSEVNQ